jgi:hypothetical protein
MILRLPLQIAISIVEVQLAYWHNFKEVGGEVKENKRTRHAGTPVLGDVVKQAVNIFWWCDKGDIRKFRSLTTLPSTMRLKVEREAERALAESLDRKAKL